MLAARISRAKYTPVQREDVPARLQQILAKTMSHDPRQRQSSMLELATELQYVQYELGLMPTALEVAADTWNAASAEVDFNNTESRGPVVTTVVHESSRVRAQKPVVAREVGDETFLRDLNTPPKKSKALVGLIVGASVIVLLAAAAIVAAVVIGGM